MIPAPNAMAANCTRVFRSSRALFGPVSRSSGITATVPTYKKVPAVKGSSRSPYVKLVPQMPSVMPIPPPSTLLPPNSCTAMPINVPKRAPRAVTN